jgi:hypothetical protein
MRHNVIIVLLSVIATLLLVDIMKPTPALQGQLGGGGTAMGGGDVLVATGSLAGGNGSAFWLYDHKDRRIAVYTLGNQGLELRSVRDIQYDLQAPYINLPQGKLTKPSEVKREVAKLKKEDKDEGAADTSKASGGKKAGGKKEEE